VNEYLIFTSDLVEHGGMDRANLEMARYVVEQGHPLHIVAHQISKRILDLPGVQAHYVPRPFRFGVVGERGLEFFGRRLAASLPRGTRIIVNGGNCAVDAVNWMHFVHRAEFVAGERVSLRKRAFRAAAMWSERRALSKARLVVANSERTQADLLKAFGFLSVPVRIVYCGVDPVRFAPAAGSARAELASRLGLRGDKRRIAFVGALGDERKGFSTLFEAWRVLVADWLDTEVVVIGIGRLLPSLMKKASRAGLKSSLRFLGRREDVAEILKCSDVLVAPSRYEPYGLNIAEALATGLPVIASRNSGATELMRGPLKELLLGDPRSIDELVQKLRLWRADSKRYEEAAGEASFRVRRHSWGEMSSEIYQLVESAFA
jgi:glycosyltransferase involved in cell wall biosynthesis